MLKEINGPYFIVCGYTDLRRSIDGLAGIIQQNYRLDIPKLGNEPTNEQLDKLLPWSETLPDYCKNA